MRGRWAEGRLSDWWHGEDQDRDAEARQILLKRQIAIRGDKGFEVRRRQSEEFSILLALPTHLPDRKHIVPRKVMSQALIHTFIQQDLHLTPARTLPFALSSNTTTC